jgi:hypothetical protein
MASEHHEIKSAIAIVIVVLALAIAANLYWIEDTVLPFVSFLRLTIPPEDKLIFGVMVGSYVFVQIIVLGTLSALIHWFCKMLK